MLNQRRSCKNSVSFQWRITKFLLHFEIKQCNKQNFLHLNKKQILNKNILIISRFRFWINSLKETICFQYLNFLSDFENFNSLWDLLWTTKITIGINLFFKVSISSQNYEYISSLYCEKYIVLQFIPCW